MPQASKAPRIAVILAGGGGRRMGGADKGALILSGRRLIDHALQRISPQVDRALISGTHDYGTRLPLVADRGDGPRGPAAGLWAALHWIEKNEPAARGFLTAPADGPFAPADIYARLSGCNGSAIAADQSISHPTFAYWELRSLRAALQASASGCGVSLRKLAQATRAAEVVFVDADAFFNINTPEDLARAENLIGG